MAKVHKFLEAGHKVKITLFYRGREQAHKEIGFNIAQKVIDGFGDTIVVEQPPQLAGKQLSFVVRHSGKKSAQPAAAIKESQGEVNAQTENP